MKEEEKTPPKTLKRPTWLRRQLNGYNYSPSNFRCIFSLPTNTNELRTVKEAMEMENKESWRLSMDKDIDTLRNNDTWYLVLLLDGWKLVGCKRVFINKIGSEVVLRSIRNGWS